MESDETVLPPDVSVADGVPSLRALFEAPASLSARRIVRCVGSYALHKAAVELGIEGTNIRNWQNTYDQLYLFFRETGDNPMVCNCDIPTGLRWQQADNKEPVTVFMHQSLSAEQQSDLMVAMALIQSRVENLKFEVTEDPLQPVDIFIDQGAIDGRNGTLGVAHFTNVDGKDDLNNDYGVELYIRFDEAERWEVTNMFLAVAIHELGHGVGVDHYDAELDNMNSHLTRILTEITAWFDSQLGQRYIVRDVSLL